MSNRTRPVEPSPGRLSYRPARIIKINNMSSVEQKEKYNNYSDQNNSG